ncbi:topoisomerase DNA-binding C4 zinc finger domain-containing protein [Bacillus sp. Marseille-Q1617]|uniref:topoisomerase DNA-binding C4 zinc finger domain-containing protein n=1 Tax=Bacillus sp. Marseille-Q1617 TaxID=2736887 RepID=UPI00158DB203|nr:topoisomerase DNA-binding C4 zinc finger domain-containing protein [Bacillus sp. Marseille-Q1617]
MMLDFNDAEQLKNFLKRDKHKLLEGLVVEDLFMRDVILTQRWETWISTGWWAINNTMKSSDYILFHVTDTPPSANDINIYKTLFIKQIVVYHVILYNNSLYFLEINENILRQPINNKDYIHESAFLSKNQLIPKNSVHIAQAETRDPFSQYRAIAYFERHDILKEVALQRYFANYFLTVHFEGSIINIDSLMNFSDGLVAFEIKYKYPDRKGEYGINKGQSNLFQWLIKFEINIHHYIAQNPSHNKEIGIFELLTSQKLKSNFHWENIRLDKDELNGTVSIAPQETSIDGNKFVKFRSIEAKKFKSTIFPVANEVDTSWIPLKKCPKCNHDKIVKKGKYGYFMGCSNYRECNNS